MYHVAVLGTPTAVLGTKLVAPQVLPFTGAMFTIYLAVAVGLIVVGTVLKVLGRRSA